MTVNNCIFTIECKSSLSPTISRGNYNSIEDISPMRTFVIAPVEKGWHMKQGIELVSLNEIEEKIKQFL